jgi:hypothetical protein
MAIENWGVIARSESTGIQIRKKLDEAHDSHDEAAVAATAWELELNTEQKFGLSDWKARPDAVEGGPHEANPDPLAGPAAQRPNPVNNPGTGTYTGLSGLLF